MRISDWSSDVCSSDLRLRPLYQAPVDGLPLIWMALFDRVEQIPANEVPALLPDPDGAWLGPLQPGISYSEYQTMAERGLRLIGAVDILQANLPFHGHVPSEGAPPALCATPPDLRGGGWGAG